MEKATQEYRQLLREKFPLNIDRVDSPWMVVPDDSNYNSRAFRMIEYELSEMWREARDNQRPSSRGVLVLGEAGTGKTHLLMRLAKQLAVSSPLLFIPRPTNEDAIAQHIWTCVVNSLGRPASGEAGGTENQLEFLLGNVFTSIAIEVLKGEIANNRNATQKQNLLKQLKTRPLKDLLGEGDVRRKNLQSVRGMVLNYIHNFKPDVNPAITDVLLTYYLTIDSNYKRTLLNWISGSDLTEEQSKKYRMTCGPVVDDGSQSQISLQQAREVHALRCLKTLGELSVYHSPLIIAFDQLEGLRNAERLTSNWGNTVRELFTSAPNFLVVTTVFPSLWKSWFAKNLDESASQRIAQIQITLEQFRPEHGEYLLGAHLHQVFSQHRLPHKLYPFTAETIASTCENATSPRQFLQSAKALLKEWVLFGNADDDGSIKQATPPLVEVTRDKITDCIAEFLRIQERKHFNEYSVSAPSEPSLFGKLRELATNLIDEDSIPQSALCADGRVLPTHATLASVATNCQVVVAVCNATSVSFSKRVSNLLRVCRGLDRSTSLCLIRDARLDRYTPSMNDAIDALRTDGHHFFELDQDEHSRIHALHDCLIAVQEGDLVVSGYAIDIATARPYLLDYVATSQRSPLFPILRSFNAQSSTPSTDNFIPLPLINRANMIDQAIQMGTL